MPGEFEWDETLYAGSAAYYATGRVPYPAELAVLREGRQIVIRLTMAQSGEYAKSK